MTLTLPSLQPDMTSWVIVGSTRGIGFEFVKQLSDHPQNTVLALIRSQKTADALNELAASRKNIHVIETDISSPQTLEETADKVSEVTGGKLDVLIYNAYLGVTETMMLTPSAFAGKEEALEREIFNPLKVNLLQQIATINAFLPLIRHGGLKKIVYITSAGGDINVIRTCELPNTLGYAVSKAAGNIMVAKYAVELKHDGIKTISINPGWVETDGGNSVTSSPEAFQWVLSAFQRYEPSVTGPISTEESVREQLAVIDGLDASQSGKFVSHHGNEVWF